MARIKPLTESELPADLLPVLQYAEASMGFRPNDVLTMARWPALLQSMLGVVGAIFTPGSVDMPLKHMVGFVTSNSRGGCRYCVAHNGHGLDADGVAPDKQAALCDFENSSLFSDAERAALTYAAAVADSPEGVTDAIYAGLQAHYDDQQIMEITAVTGLFGFLNRWNSTFQTELEPAPRIHAEAHLAPHGWDIGGHE